MKSNEKGIVLFFLLMFAWLMVYPHLMQLLGLERAPRKPRPAAQAPVDLAGDRKAGDGIPAAKAAPGERVQAGPDQGAGPAEAKSRRADEDAAPKATVALAKESDLVLGALQGQDPSGYRLRVQLQQKGAGIESVASSQYDAEFEEGRPRKRPLLFIKRDPVWPPSLALTFSLGEGAKQVEDPVPEDAEAETRIPKEVLAAAEDLLDSKLWEVVSDDQGRIVRPVSGTDRITKKPVDGQEAVFRTTAGNGVVVTKTFRLFKNADGLELEISLLSPDKERSVIYNLLGPHGIPIEGEWYTSTYRDLAFGQVSRGSTEIVTYSAYDVASATKPVENTKLPLRFVGIENQYFATLLEPDPPPTGEGDRWDSTTTALVLHKDKDALQKADIGVRISSKRISLGPNQNVVHRYVVFAGPKTADALRAYGADGLASYRKNQWIPFASDLARYVITPTLGLTYQVTARSAQLLGLKQGNYGLAIILLTVLVRGLMFPLGRKQALSAQKMQELQPRMKEIQEKYKNEKEKLTQETLALYKRHGVNPVSGCVPALIQLPIFVGLWQALNTSVPLRHATFLWIRDLAAPDMLFRFPVELPFLGKWFNLLPFVVVGLMLFQTKLFSPPATTPEAELQQKTMKYMMVFMGFMFYKVPSGLGIYFITSSLWAIGERLLLPKVTAARAAAEAGAATVEAGRAGGAGGLNGDGDGARATKGAAASDGAKPKLPGKLTQFWERVLDEARKDSTYRKMMEDHEQKGRDKGKPRAKPRKR
jgi:YidC/Oxa1 family membrane protein insertase